MKPIRVLPIEPDQWRYLGILHLLSSEPELGFCVVGDRDFTKVLALKRTPPDLDPEVVMLARILVAGPKIPLLARIKQLFPRAHVLVHGYDAHTGRIGDFLAAGATGYFLLSSNPKDLILALRHVAKGLIWGPAEAVTLMVNRLRKNNADGMDPVKFVTPHETALLKLLKDGLSNKEIASTLGLAEVTVKSRLTKLYKRFNIRTRLQLLSYAMKQDLIVSEGAGSKAAIEQTSA